MESYQVTVDIRKKDQCLTTRQIVFQDRLYQRYSEGRQCLAH